MEHIMSSTSPYPRRWWALAVLSLGLLVISLDNTILNVALPSLSDDLGATSSQLQWIVDSYMLVFAGLLLTAGSLGDRFGRKRALTLGLFIFGAASAASAMAQTPAALIAGRALMGIGGALIMPSTLSIVTATFPADERPKAIGIWAAVAGIGIAIGPVAGGWLVENASWHWVFLVNVPFVLVALAAGQRLIPESRDPSQSRLDPIGAAISTAGLGTLLWGIISASDRGWGDQLVGGALILGALLLVLFVWFERRTESPMLDMAVFRNPRFSASSAAITIAFFVLMGLMFFLTQYLQDVLGLSPFDAGVRMLPVAGGMVVGGPLGARLAERFGAKLVVASGLAFVAGAMALLAQADVSGPYGLIAAALALMGFGMGTAMSPATDAIMGTLDERHLSVGSAMNDATRLVGGALGVAVLGSLMTSHYGGAMQSAPAAAQDSVGAAHAVASHLPPAAGSALDAAANGAFVDAMHMVLYVSVAVLAVGVAITLRFLPARAQQRRLVRAEAVPA
jgi:EmrB/QacA subfamily drug resistance transporter